MKGGEHGYSQHYVPTKELVTCFNFFTDTPSPANYFLVSTKCLKKITFFSHGFSSFWPSDNSIILGRYDCTLNSSDGSFHFTFPL